MDGPRFRAEACSDIKIPPDGAENRQKLQRNVQGGGLRGNSAKGLGGMGERPGPPGSVKRRLPGRSTGSSGSGTCLIPANVGKSALRLATEEQELADLYHDNGDVVQLRHRGGLPSADLGEQSLC